MGLAAVDGRLGGRAYLYEINQQWIETTTLIGTLAALAIILGGFRLLRWAFPGLIFLIFMFPLPPTVNGFLAGPLQWLATQGRRFAPRLRLAGSDLGKRLDLRPARTRSRPGVQRPVDAPNLRRPDRRRDDPRRSKALGESRSFDQRGADRAFKQHLADRRHGLVLSSLWTQGQGVRLDDRRPRSRRGRMGHDADRPDLRLAGTHDHGLADHGGGSSLDHGPGV